MGAWNTGTFDNDDAADWLIELRSADDGAILIVTLEAADIGKNYLEAPEGARIICACELVAALTGQAAIDLPEIAREWVRQHHHELDVTPLLPIAKSGIDRVLAEYSELEELWRENADEYAKWRKNVLALKTRLVT